MRHAKAHIYIYINLGRHFNTRWTRDDTTVIGGREYKGCLSKDDEHPHHLTAVVRLVSCFDL